MGREADYEEMCIRDSILAAAGLDDVGDDGVYAAACPLADALTDYGGLVAGGEAARPLGVVQVVVDVDVYKRQGVCSACPRPPRRVP